MSLFWPAHNETDMEDFANFITTRRRELELTLGDVATKLDVSPITVSNWSNGQATPDPEQLTALAALLEVPAEDLTSMAGLEPVPEDRIDIPPDAFDPVEPAVVDIPQPEAVDPLEPTVPTHSEPIAAVEPAPEPVERMTPPPATGPPEVAAVAQEVAIPAFVESPQAERPRSRQAGRPSRRASGTTLAAERPPPTLLPLTYIEDPKQLMRYRIRWAITLVALVIMFFVLLWASAGLISALSDIKESVTPGGGGS